MRIALVGQPNCGKSTLFNQVAGYKAHTGNFPGTTVTYTESKVRLQGEVVDVVDLPGTYTLAGTNPAERVTLRYLASTDVDVIINVLDATHLSQGLDMTLELLELQRPLILAVNLLDEPIAWDCGSTARAFSASSVCPYCRWWPARGAACARCSTPPSRRRATLSRSRDLATAAMSRTPWPGWPRRCAGHRHHSTQRRRLAARGDRLAAETERITPAHPADGRAGAARSAERRGQPARWVVWASDTGWPGT
jgi:small GTP-binding protein